MTYHPSIALTIFELLRVCPLAYEVVRRVELRGKRKLAKPVGVVPQQGIFLSIISICDKRSSERETGKRRMNDSKCGTYCRYLSSKHPDWEQRHPIKENPKKEP